VRGVAGGKNVRSHGKNFLFVAGALMGVPVQTAHRPGGTAAAGDGMLIAGIQASEATRRNVMKFRRRIPLVMLLAVCWPVGALLQAEELTYGDDLRHVEDPGEEHLRAMQQIPETTTYPGLRGLLQPGVGDETVRDMRIAGRIGIAYFEEELLDRDRISVEVDGGVVHLAGEVPSDQARELAERIASEIPNVSSVNNELRVGPE
jgi:hypothetical protein